MKHAVFKVWIWWCTIIRSMLVCVRMDDKVTGHCMRCKEKREMKDVEKTEIKPGTPAAKGKCTVCDAGMYKILPKNA